MKKSLCKKIIIIGVGLSGLYAGYLLKKMGYEVTILEARNRVGGRTLTENSVDLGGTWISSKHRRVMKLIEQFDLHYYAQFNDGKHVSYFDNKRNEISGTFYDSKKDEEEVSVERYLDTIYSITNNADFLDDPLQLDKVSFERWSLENIPSEMARRHINYSFRLLTCVDPKLGSMFFWLYFLKNCGGYKTLASVKEGAQEFRIQEGAQILSQKLAENLNIIYSAEVVKIAKKILSMMFTQMTIVSTQQVWS